MDATPVRQRARRPAAETPYRLQASGTPGLSVALLEGGKTRDVLKTVEAGKLDLERPLSQYVDKPSYVDDADLGRITPRHVLTHTTGWPNWPDEGKPIQRVRPLGQWGCSGAGFVYLQKVLEAIWNEPAAHYTRRLVLDPLEMRESNFVWRDEYAKTAARGFDPDRGALAPWHPTEVNGASSLHTTAREYALLLEAYLRRDLCQRHPGVYRRQVEIDARLGWSLGWGTAGDALWQWGHRDGFKTFSALVPTSGRGIVVLSNSAGGQRVNR